MNDTNFTPEDLPHSMDETDGEAVRGSNDGAVPENDGEHRESDDDATEHDGEPDETDNAVPEDDGEPQETDDTTPENGGKPRKKAAARKKKKNRFFIFYIVFCGVLAFAISCGVGIFYDFIREYENSLPEHVLEDYIGSLSGDELTSVASAVIEEAASGFETVESYADTFKETVSQGLTFTSIIGEDGETGTYDVYCDGKLMRVTLTVSYVGKYGFPHFAVCSAELYPEWVESRTMPVTVIVPDGASLYINGKPVGEEYMTGEKFESTSLSVFDRRDHALVTYEIENFFGTPSVSGEYKGEPLEVTELGEGAFCSDYDLDSRHDYTIKAPSGAVVTVGGITLGEEYVTGTEKVDALRTEFEPDGTPELSLYRLEKLLGIPVIEVEFEGKLLSPVVSNENQSEYGHPDGYLKTYTIRVPQGMRLYCNGIEVGSGYTSGDGELYETPASALGANSTERFNIYSVALCHDPTFTVPGIDVVAVNDTDYTFYPAPTNSQRSEVESAAVRFAERFIRYNLRGARELEVNYDACLDCALPKSEAYKIIRDTYNAVLYNNAYEITKLDTRAYDFVRYSDDCVTVKVDFESTGKRGRYAKDNNGTYSMVFVKSGGEWMLAGFSL